MPLFLICFTLIFLAFVGLFIKGILTKKGTLSQTCASSINPDQPCQVCGATSQKECSEG